MPGSVKTNSDRLLVLRQKGHKEDECWKKQADSGRVKAQEVESDIELRHKQFAHINFPKLQDMQSKQVVFGLPKFSGQKGRTCEACQLGKQRQLPFPNECNRSSNKLDLIHSHVWGLVYNISFRGSQYFFTFIDDFSRHTWIFPIEKKSNLQTRA